MKGNEILQLPLLHVHGNNGLVQEAVILSSIQPLLIGGNVVLVSEHCCLDTGLGGIIHPKLSGVASHLILELCLLELVLKFQSVHLAAGSYGSLCPLEEGITLPDALY